MKFFSLFFLLIGGFLVVNAQQYNPDKVHKKIAALYEKAMIQAQNGDFRQSITTLHQAVKQDPKFMDGFLSIAGLHSELKEYTEAITYYEKSRAMDQQYFRDYLLPYSINLAGLGKFNEALQAVNEFLEIPNLNSSSLKAANFRKKTYLFALQYIQNNPETNYLFEPRNMGNEVNSEFSEYYPTLTIDGKTLIFTRRVNHINEDFYQSTFEQKQWNKAEGLTGAINSANNEGAQNISQDGEWLLFTGCSFPDGYGSCDLYISFLTPSGWSRPENLGRNINTNSWESAPSLSPDKRQLYFTSNRPGGFGGSDLYVSTRLENGTWGAPLNLGPNINTPGDEGSPFIHADNQTLYFTSNGHLGYGGDDLFVTRKNENQQWQKPVNLGFPINTIENEGSLVVASDGKTAYYSSDRADSKGGLDIYTFELREDIRPNRTLWVKGKVFDQKTSKGLPSLVELIDLNNGQVISKLQTDASGQYLTTLPVGHEYVFNVSRKGYLFFSENFSILENDSSETLVLDIPLQPLETNATIVLKNIFFDVNSFELKPASKIELNRLVTLLQENPGLNIQINGHTDNVGKPADNLILSNERAKAVVAYLITQGIEPGRLSAKGFGAQEPIAENDTEKGRAQNRRTEVMIKGQ